MRKVVRTDMPMHMADADEREIERIGKGLCEVYPHK